MRKVHTISGKPLAKFRRIFHLPIAWRNFVKCASIVRNYVHFRSRLGAHSRALKWRLFTHLSAQHDNLFISLLGTKECLFRQVPMPNTVSKYYPWSAQAWWPNLCSGTNNLRLCSDWWMSPAYEIVFFFYIVGVSLENYTKCWKPTKR